MGTRQRTWAQTVTPTGGGGATPTFGNVAWTPGSDGGLKPEMRVQCVMGDLALNRNQSIGVQSTFALAVAADRSIGVKATGSVLAAPFWQSVGTVDSLSALTTVIIPKPSGLSVGDLMLAFVSSDAATLTTLPAGWTLIRNTQRIGVLSTTINSSWKIADAADVLAVTFTFTLSTASGHTGCIHRINGTHATVPIDVSAESTGAAADPVTASVTTTVVNTLIFVACSQRQTLNESFSPPANYVERTDQTGFITVGTVHTIDTSTANRVQAAIAANGAQTFDSTALIAADYATQTIAVSPGELVLAA